MKGERNLKGRAIPYIVLLARPTFQRPLQKNRGKMRRKLKKFVWTVPFLTFKQKKGCFWRK